MRHTASDARIGCTVGKRGAEPVARLGRATDADAQARRDGCAPACLSHIGGILARYEAAPSLLEAQDIDDRAMDFWAPLLALALTGDGEAGGKRARRSWVPPARGRRCAMPRRTRARRRSAGRRWRRAGRSGARTWRPPPCWPRWRAARGGRA
jgi:hypothetical protein